MKTDPRNDDSPRSAGWTAVELPDRGDQRVTLDGLGAAVTAARRHRHNASSSSNSADVTSTPKRTCRRTSYLSAVASM